MVKLAEEKKQVIVLVIVILKFTRSRARWTSWTPCGISREWSSVSRVSYKYRMKRPVISFLLGNQMVIGCSRGVYSDQQLGIFFCVLRM